MTARLCSTAAALAYHSLTGKLLPRRSVRSAVSTRIDWQSSLRIKSLPSLPLSSPLRSQQRRIAGSTIVRELATAALPDWPGLQVWRDSEVDSRRVWGEKGAVPVVSTCWGF